jgi:hypothetical protein
LRITDLTEEDRCAVPTSRQQVVADLAFTVV